MAKPKPLFEHRMGRRSGYDVYRDGSISLAPMWTDRIAELTARETGLREMQHGVNVYVADQFTHLAKEKRRWWDEVFAELEIPKGSGHYTYIDGVLRKDEAASGTEAGTGETEGLDPKGDGPTLEERDAQTPVPSSRERK